LEEDEHKKLSEIDRLVARFQDETLLPIGKALAAWIRSLSPDGSPPALKVVRAASFPDISADLLTNTEKLLAGSLLVGMDHASPATTLADSDYTPLPFDEAIKFLKSRVSLTKAEWAALEPKLAFRSFTMAKLTQCDYIEAVRGRLVTALEKGEGYDQAWSDIKAIAEADGSTIKPGYWETVYRTNVQTAYNAGRRMQFDRDPPSAIALMVLEDERTSDICRPLAGLVLPYNHPFWQDHWPPFHFNCRTTVRAIYDYEVGQVPVKNVPMKRLRKEFHPQSGFGQNPVQTGSFWKLTPTMLERIEKYDLKSEIRSFARSLGIQYDPVLGSALTKDGVVIKADPIKGNISKVREDTKKYLESLKGSIFYNENIKGPIVVTSQGIKKATSFSGDSKKLAALNKIPEILEQMSLVSSMPDKDNNTNVLEVIKAKAILEIEGEKHIFNVTLKHMKSNNSFLFYDLSTHLIK